MNDNLQDQHSSAAVECTNRKGLDPLHMPMEGFSPSSENNAAFSETNPNCFELEFKDLQTWLKKNVSQHPSLDEFLLLSYSQSAPYTFASYHSYT